MKNPESRPPAAETLERQAAFARGRAKAGEPEPELCAPEIDGLNADLLFTLVAENVRDYAVFLLDANGVIECWGEGARLMKWWTKHEAKGAHLRLLYPDGGSEDGTAEEHLESAAQRGEYTGEGHRIRSDGSTFWAGVTLTALHNAEGRLVGFAKLTRDFSARRAVEAALAQQAQAAEQPAQIIEESKRLKMMVATVSHELRTPLNAMMGYVALLAQQVDDPEQQMFVQKLQRSSQHLLQIIEDALDLSRADAGSLTVHQSMRRLGAAIQDALVDVEADAARMKVSMINSVSGSAADLPYLGDEGRMRQIIVNLLSNAIKFTGRGGRITLSAGTGASVVGAAASGDGPWVYVRVEDTGRGIPADRLDSIFEPFQQSDASDQHRGMGLGLSISRHLARLMGGDITVQSTVGAGSTFTLWVPIAPSDPVPR